MTTTSTPFQPGAPLLRYSDDIEHELTHLTAAIQQVPTLTARYPARWLAVQLLENDATLLAEVRESDGGASVIAAWEASMARLQRTYGDDVDMVLTDDRYRFVNSLVGDVVQRRNAHAPTISDKIDRIVTHRYLGIPIFLGLMYCIFYLVQHVSAPYLDWVDGIISGPLTTWSLALLGSIGVPLWVHSLVADGAIAGVGGVLVFIPGLMVLFFMLALLEDSGYMSRAAFVMDRLMSAFGLDGKAFLPMIIGFGCNVPGIYATRTMENNASRILTGLLIPFMSCSARLPVYVVFGLAFFPRNAGIMILAFYLLGVAVALTLSLILSRLAFKGQLSSFVMEVPPYRIPSMRTMLSSMWEQTSHFVYKAGTFILAISVVLWFLLNLPWGVQDQRDSFYGQVSATIAPIFAPAGFGEWRASGSLITGLIAKEMIVSTLSQVYVGGESAESDTSEPPPAPDIAADIESIVVGFGSATVEAGRQFLEMLTPGVALFPADEEPEDIALSSALQRSFTPLTAFAFLVFVLLYIPCVPTLAAQVQEYGWRWAAFGATLQTLIPWTLAVVAYQVGRLLGFS